MIVALRRGLVALVAVVLIASACGGDDDAAADDPSEDPGITTTAGSGDDDASAGGDVDLSDLFSGRCQEAAAGIAAAMSAYSTGLASIFGGELDEDELQASADQLQSLAAGAPDELKDDLDVIAQALTEFYGAFADIGFDPTSQEGLTAEQLEQLGALAEQFDDSAYQAAADNISTWFDANCN